MSSGTSHAHIICPSLAVYHPLLLPSKYERMIKNTPCVFPQSSLSPPQRTSHTLPFSLSLLSVVAAAVTSTTWSPAFSPDQMALYFVLALATTALPAFLYHGIYSVDIHTYSLVYIAVCLISATLLTLAYKQTENNTHISLAATRAAQPLPRHLRTLSKDTVLSSQEAVTTLEAASWGFLVVNLLYVVLFFGAGFLCVEGVRCAV